MAPRLKDPSTRPPCSFHVACPERLLLDQCADKWTMLVLAVLDRGPARFNSIKRQLEGITQKALTQCLRRLERNGLVLRRVLPLSPVAVEYEMTPLGRALGKPMFALYEWMVDNLPRVEKARRAYDAREAG